jgi:hypothetical protein
MLKQTSLTKFERILPRLHNSSMCVNHHGGRRRTFSIICSHPASHSGESENDNNGQEDNRHVFAILVTPEQEEIICGFMQFHDKNIDLAPVPVHQDDDDFTIDQDPAELECSHCFCRPCITDERNRQMWWETDSQEPDELNSGRRKAVLVYRRYWTMMYHRQVWNDLKYLEKKALALQRRPGRKKPVYHRRDIMPNCVIDLLRRWFPNPEKSRQSRHLCPYMGHKWD